MTVGVSNCKKHFSLMLSDLWMSLYEKLVYKYLAIIVIFVKSVLVYFNVCGYFSLFLLTPITYHSDWPNLFYYLFLLQHACRCLLTISESLKQLQFLVKLLRTPSNTFFCRFLQHFLFTNWNERQFCCKVSLSICCTNTPDQGWTGT